MNRRVILIAAVLIITLALIVVAMSLSSHEGTLKPTPTPEPIILARVDGEPIEYSAWATQYMLDQLMSELAGQLAPAPRETLDRMINNVLVLQAYPPQHTPSADEVSQRIQALLATWSISDADLDVRLSEIPIARETFELTVAYFLSVEASQQLLMAEHDPTSWIAQARAEANIIVNENLIATLPIFQE